MIRLYLPPSDLCEPDIFQLMYDCHVSMQKRFWIKQTDIVHMCVYVRVLVGVRFILSYPNCPSPSTTYIFLLGFGSWNLSSMQSSGTGG